MYPEVISKRISIMDFICTVLHERPYFASIENFPYHVPPCSHKLKKPWALSSITQSYYSSNRTNEYGANPPMSINDQNLSAKALGRHKEKNKKDSLSRISCYKNRPSPTRTRDIDCRRRKSVWEKHSQWELTRIHRVSEDGTIVVAKLPGEHTPASWKWKRFTVRRLEEPVTASRHFFFLLISYGSLLEGFNVKFEQWMKSKKILFTLIRHLRVIVCVWTPTTSHWWVGTARFWIQFSATR